MRAVPILARSGDHSAKIILQIGLHEGEIEVSHIWAFDCIWSGKRDGKIFSPSQNENRACRVQAKGVFEMKCLKVGLGALCGGLLIAASATSASAVSNPSFESGDFSDWSTVGQAVVRTTFGVSPTDGDYQAMMWTNVHGELSPDKSAQNDLAGYLGVNLGGNTTDGSAISQTFNVAQASTLSFDWAFGWQPNEFGGNDVAFAVLNGTVYELGSLFSIGGLPNKVNNYSGNGGISNYYTFTGLPELQAGSHTLALGIVNVADGRGRTALLVDNLIVSAVSGGQDNFAPAPEPLTAGLLAMSVGAVTLSMRRRRHIDRADRE
jgi:hypothetical protein